MRTNLTVFGAQGLRRVGEDGDFYGRMLQSCARFGANVAVLNVRDDAWDRLVDTPSAERTIALWWSDDQVGQLNTLLAWLCTRHAAWSDATIVVYVPSGGSEEETERVTGLLQAARITAEVVPVDGTPASFSDALSGSTLALAPLRIRRGAAIGPFNTPLGMLLESLPLAVMLLATDEVDLDAEPDESNLAEMAQLSDQAASASRRAAELDAEAARLLVAAEALRLDAKGNPSDAELAAAAKDAQDAAAQAYRAYVDARVRCTALEDRVAALDPGPARTNIDPNVWRSSSERGK